uniref:Uncharacterized protein n=1 Tax=Arundo donax TaxID=35708 RepID=A0A0A9F1T2_ARUDO
MRLILITLSIYYGLKLLE